MNVRAQPVITADAARRVVDAATEAAQRMGVAVVVAVVDPGGQPIAFTRMDGSPMLSIDIASDKAWTAVAFGQSTRWWAETVATDPGLAALGANNRLMPVAGGVPVVVDGAVAGGVGVSGASADQDHAIAEAGAAGVAALTAAGMEDTIRRYFDACNTGDAAAVASFFTPDAVHYFPPGMYQGPFVGAGTIGRRWAEAVERLGSMWTVDHVICEPTTARAVIEWTHWKTGTGTILRGDEWYVFERGSGLIAEIRAYYASPQDPSLDRLELGGFDYPGRGYPITPPFTR
jgi:uncharacterized protein GlcG (DUF336 family)/ketosteroid isomerase-like protein